ncbi:MAG: hypothetical protein IJF68_01130 [Opitutales bacterium]|nr:hypothetical protein [Opitutales bacterium]
MSGNMKLLWVALSAVACAFPETELRGGVAPVSASEEAGTLIAARTSEAWLEELKDLIVRRENFFSEAETLSENERSRRASDIAARFEAHLERFPDSFPGLYFYADFLHEGGENERAEKYLLRAEKLAPDLAPIQFLLGKILAEKGAVRDAFERFRNGFSLGVPDAESAALYGEFLLENRAFLLAEKCIENRAELDDAMLRAFRLAAILSGENTDFYWRYAEAFYDIETPDMKSALLAWENVARLPEVQKRQDLAAAVALHRARVLAELGRIEEADTILRETVGFPQLERSRRKVFEIIYRKRREK